MKTVKSGRVTEVHPGKAVGRFWLIAGATLLTWQINNQVVRADTAIPTDQPVSVSSEKPAIINNNSSAPQPATSAESSATSNHGSQADLAVTISESATPKNSAETSQGSVAKSEQSKANSQMGSAQATGEQSAASTATPVSMAQQAVSVDALVSQTKKRAQFQPAIRRLRMAAPAVQPAVVNDHTSGTLGTSQWSIDTAAQTLTIGPGTLADTGVTADAEGKVTDWKGLDWNNYQVNGSKVQLELQLNGPVIVGKDASYLFSGLRFNGNILADGTNLDTSNTTNMTGMFSKASIWASNEDNDKVTFNLATSEVKTMAHMFDGARLHNEVFTFSKLDMDNVTDLTGMFENAGGGETIDLSGLDTSNVVSMAHMFDTFYGPKAINVSSFNTSKVTDMSYMFNQCSLLKTLDLSNFDTAKVTSMAYMLYNLQDTISLNVSKLDTRSVTDMSYMFFGDHTPINLAEFNTEKVTNMAGMFGGTYFTEPIKHFENIKTDNVTNMAGMFLGADLSKMNLSGFKTDNVTDMSGMFSRAKSFSNSDIANFNTSKVTNMASMFNHVNPDASSQENYFTTIDLSHLDTSHVTDMSKMLANNSHLTTVNFGDSNSKFDTSQVTNMFGMFLEDSALTELDVSKFNTKNVVDMSIMFNNDTQLKRLDLSNFETPNLESVYGMFWGDGALEYLNLAAFDTRRIINTVHKLNGFGLRALGWFNAPALLFDPQDAVVNPQVLVLGANTQLKMDWPMNEFTDVIVPDDPDNPIFAPLTLADAAQLLGYKSVDDMRANLFTVGLQPASTATGLWVNADTGERLTAQALMGNYGSDQATAGTWTWQTIVGKDVTMIAHPNAEWTPADSFDQAVDENNQPINDLKKFTVTLWDKNVQKVVDQIDPTKAGNYTVTYSYVGDDNVTRTSGPVALTIAANQDAINVQDIVLQLNDTLQAQNYLQSVINADGNPVDFSGVTMSDTVNSQVPGQYTVTYQFTDLFGDVFQKTVTVVVNGLTLKQGNLSVSTDDRWDPQTNVAAAVDDTGKTVTPEQMVITMTDDAGHVVSNLKRPGQYQVSYSFSDGHGIHSQQAIVTVVAGVNHAELQLKSDHVTIYEHDEWSPLSNVSALTDSGGKPISPENWAQLLQVDGQVDTAKAGDYPVTYRFVDLFGQTHTAKMVVTIKSSQADLIIKNDAVQVYEGASWTAADNLVSVTDVDGSTVDPNNITINSNVDLTRPGYYLVTYRFTDQHNKLHTATTAVTVLANQANLTVKDAVVHLTVGDQWDALTNLQQVTDIDGTTVQPSAIQVDSSVNLNVPGSYGVTYQFTDQLGKVHTAQTQVIVEAKTDPDDGGNGAVEVPDENGDNGDNGSGKVPDDNQNQGNNKPGKIPDDNSGQETTEAQDPEQLPEGTETESLEQTTEKNDVEALPKNVAVKPTEQLSVATDHLKTLQPIKPMLKTKAISGLPQTSEQVDKHLSVIGLVVLALSSLGLPWLIKGKKDQDN